MSDYRITGPASVDAAGIDRILAGYHSPFAGSGRALAAAAAGVGIDPLYALAIWAHESQCGTAGAAVAHHNPGNLRHEPPYPETGGFVSFPDWAAGCQGWFSHMVRVYVMAGLVTLDQIVPVYAPAADGNDPGQYLATVQRLVDTWQTLVPHPLNAPPSPLPTVNNTMRAPASSYYPGRAGHPVTFLIRHNTEGLNSLAWFTDPASGVSIHHLIARDGTRYDMVHRADIAFHVGDSAWGAYSGGVSLPAEGPAWPDGCGVALLNAISIGMEFESTANRGDAGNGYTDPQLWTGAYTEACTLVGYGLDARAVLDHKAIALPPGRRVDPSHFPYDVYLPRVAAWVAWLRRLSAAELAGWIL